MDWVTAYSYLRVELPPFVRIETREHAAKYAVEFIATTELPLTPRFRGFLEVPKETLALDDRQRFAAACRRFSDHMADAAALSLAARHDTPEAWEDHWGGPLPEGDWDMDLLG